MSDKKQHKKQAEKPGQEQESEPTLWAFAALFPVQFLYKNYQYYTDIGATRLLVLTFLHLAGCCPSNPLSTFGD